MASLAVLLIILGCGALMYFKGTVVQALAMIVIAILSGVVAFGFFESCANIIISRGNDGSLLSLVPWAHMLSFLLLYIVTFALFQTAATFLNRHPVDFGFIPELAGRIICGIILGFIISGHLLTALQMAPLSLSYPYQRFESPRNIENAKGGFLNADGFATGLFGIISNGSLSGKNNFKTIHSNYLDQLYMNRILGKTSSVSGLSPAIEIPKPGVWPVSENVIDAYAKTDSRPIIPIPNISYNATIVRVGIKKRAIQREASINGGVFTPSQLRLICTRSTGEVANVYPVGYMKTENEMEASKEIKISTTDIGEGNARYIDFVFCVPSGYDPTFVGFKLNSIIEIPAGAIVSADQAPAVSRFSSSASAPQSNTQKPPRTQSQQQQPQQQRQSRPRRSGPSDISRSIVGDELDQ